MINPYSFIELYSYKQDHPLGEPILDAMLPLMIEHPGIRARQIARQLDVRQNDLSGAVRILTGYSLDPLLSQWRMYKALELLRTTNLSFTEIARICGYRQNKHLAKAMKRALKMTPFEYRNGYRRTVERPTK